MVEAVVGDEKLRRLDIKTTPNPDNISGEDIFQKRDFLRLILGLFVPAAAVGAGILTPGAAFASSKVEQTQAGYKNSPRGDARCDKCLQFQPPSACKIVDGVVSPAGSCNFYAPRG